MILSENPGEVVAVSEACFFGDFTNGKASLTQHLICFFHSYLCQVFNEGGIKVGLAQLAEIF